MGRSLQVAPSLGTASRSNKCKCGLFNRSTRKAELTDAGSRYFDRCQHLVDEARLAQESLRESAALPSGHVRVSMPVDLGVFIIGPLLPEFARQNPGISFDLDLSPRHADLVGDHVDVAIRLGTVKDGKLIVRRLGSVEQALYASPAYQDLRGRLQQPADLVEHDCIVARNLGIAALVPNLALDAVTSGRLLPVLPDWTVPRLPIQAVLSSRLQPACVMALLDFLAARLAVV